MPRNSRIHFQTLISVEIDRITQVSEFIGKTLTKSFGGATLSPRIDCSTVTGFWSDDGHQFKDSYTGKIHSETVLEIHLSVLEEDHQRALDVIRATSKTAVNQFNLSSRFIHIESYETQVWHTDLETIYT